MSKYLILAFTLTMNMNGHDTGIYHRGIEPGSIIREEGVFLGSGMSGVVITLNSGHSRSDQRYYIIHLDSRHGSVEAFVPALRTSPLNSLLDVVGGEHPVNHRDTSLQANRSYPF